MTDAAKAKRREQLKRWAGSSTDMESIVARRRWRGSERATTNGRPGEDSETVAVNISVKRRRRVRFDRAAEFLASCACGDIDEAKEMLTEAGHEDGVVNSANADGITALHQACIDGSIEVVMFLLDHGANVTQADNEGWTPLHVAASCGNLEISEYLLQHGANLCAVNCDGDVPLDIAEDEATETLLREHMQKQGVDVSAAKKEEEERLLSDACVWQTEGLPSELRHPRTGATPLHVAAAKGYVEVIRLLCQCGMDVSVMDNDGWTPLHAAAHWGQGEACRILARQLCNMEAQSKSGQTPFDVADESMEALLTELVKKQADWRSEQSMNERQNAPESPTTTTPNKSRRSSVCRMSSREKMYVQDQSKERGVPGGLHLQEERESSPESSNLSSPESESITTSTTSPADKSQEERDLKERESRTARVQPTLQRKDSSTSDSPSSTAEMRKFHAPVRDEESESQRKARSRLLRQSRRSTQGVTLTDLKEAEKSVAKASEAQRSVQPVSPVITVTPAERDMGPVKSCILDGEKGVRQPARDRRRGRRERRSTGLLNRSSGEVDDSDTMDEILSDSSSTHSEPQLDDILDSTSSPDYRMLYTEVLRDNEELREKLQETELLLSQNKVELERIKQNQEQSCDRPALLELERFEKKALERKALELEDELKVLADLKADNQRLKDENAALIRVISKLSR